MEPERCGKCRVIIMHDPDGTGIQPCKLHAAAPALLEALKRIAESCGPLQDGEEWGDVIVDIRLAARDAIEAAKGKA